MFFYQGAVVRWPETHEEGMREVNNYAKYLKKIIKKI
jgi:hypothetical protein